MNQKVQNSMIKRGERDLANFDKQIASLEERAKKAVLPFEEKINELQRLRAGLVDYLSRFQPSDEGSSVDDNENLPASDNLNTSEYGV